MKTFNVMSSCQELVSPRGDLTIVLDVEDVLEYGQPSVTIRSNGRTSIVGFDDALRRGIADDLLLTDDHLTWLRSQRQQVDEWTATWARLA